MSNVRRFRRNPYGRDFVVGDIHGHYSDLMALLEKASFDEITDRLFSTGDLVDRGPASERCARLLSEPWFHAVRGNHEQMAIDCVYGHSDPALYEINGGKWFLDLPKPDRQDLADLFLDCPIAIEIESDHGLIGVVHAEAFFETWAEFTKSLDLEHNQIRAMWSRGRIDRMNTSWIHGVARIFVGHTPRLFTCILGNHHYIDTGAFKGGKLTMVELDQHFIEHSVETKCASW